MKSKPDAHETNSDSYSAELQTHVLEVLGSNLRSLAIEISDSGIVLRGLCVSFHTKQMVQEIVAKSTSLLIVANDLVVQQPSCELQPLTR